MSMSFANERLKQVVNGVEEAQGEAHFDEPILERFVGSQQEPPVVITDAIGATIHSDRRLTDALSTQDQLSTPRLIAPV